MTLDQQELLVGMVLKERLEPLAQRGLVELREVLGRPELKDFLEIQECQEQQVPLVQVASLALREAPVRLVELVLLVAQDNQELRVQLAIPEFLVQQVPRGVQDRLDQRDRRATRVSPESVERLEIQVELVALEPLDQPAYLEQLVRRDLLVNREQLDLKDNLVPPVHRVILVHLEELDKLDRLEQRALQDHRGLLVLLELPGLKVQLERRVARDNLAWEELQARLELPAWLASPVLLVHQDRQDLLDQEDSVETPEIQELLVRRVPKETQVTPEPLVFLVTLVPLDLRVNKDHRVLLVHLEHRDKKDLLEIQAQ